MATISSLGSSGLELEGILEKLQAAEEKKLTLITARQASYETRISAYSKIQAAVEAVQKAAATLGSIDTLSAVKAVVSGDGLSVKTAAGAVPGQYTVNIDKLATAQNLQSGELDSRTDKHGTGGSIEIVQKDGTTTTVTLGEDTSLNGIVKAINGTDGLDVRATVISDGNGKHYLMLNNKTEGTEAAVTRITVSGNQEVADILDFDAANAGASNLTVQLAAQKAELTINGIPVVSDTNTVETAIDGLTLTLTKQTAAPLTVTVSSDPSVAATAVNDFVKAYNGLQTTIADLTAVDVKAEKQSALTGDGTTRNIQSAIAAALRVATGEGTLRTLSQLGITTDPKTGSLKTDTEKLEAALRDNPADVARIFSGPFGLGEKVKLATEQILGDEGSIKIRQEGLEETLESLQNQYDRQKLSIAATIEAYRKQFVQLDVFVTQMNNTSNYLSQQFAALSGTKK